jgi:hypothetical protein
MLDCLFGVIFNELGSYFEENASLPIKWVILEAINILQQYPSGISKAVLLTELEYKWFVVALILASCFFLAKRFYFIVLE